MDLNPQLRFLGIWPGEVVENDDPEGLHRIRYHIPGLIEKSPWAMPAGVLADTEEGTWAPPKIGMNVWCAFVAGDPKKPIYWGGPWGAGDAPFDSIHERGIRWDDYQLKIDEEEHTATLEDRVLGIKVELNRTTGQLTLYGPAEIILNSLGSVRITGTAVEILGRQVVPGAGPIR